MKSTFITLQNLRLALSLTIALCSPNALWSAPSIQSIDVSPNPLVTARNFTIAIAASPDVTLAVARVDFRAADPRSIEIPLTQQGGLWTGSGVVPTDLRVQLPGDAGGMVKVAVFNAAHQHAEKILHIGVKPSTVSAVFAGGVLTVTGDDQDNTLIVSRDAAGNILVSADGSPLEVSGGAPTVSNTTLITILGLKGNDVLKVDDINGPMPS